MYTKFLIILGFLILPMSLFSTGIEFFHGSWDEAIAKAKTEGKIIFVDAYTTWCGPCKRMARDVFTDSKVGQFYNANFVNMKLDMEKKAGISFQRKYPVSSYPTLYFIDSDGKVVQKVKGSQPVDAFLSLGKSILSKVDFSKEYATAYEEGNREPELIINYVKALIKSNKPSGRIANAYLKSQTDLSTAFNIEFIFEAMAEADSRIFELYTDHKAEIVKLKGEGAYLDRIKKACERTVQKAIEFESPDLLKEAKDKMKSHCSKQYTEFAFLSDLNFCAASRNAQSYLKAAKTYSKKIGNKDAQQIFDLCQKCIADFPNNNDLLKEAISMNKKAFESTSNPEYGFHLAQLYYKNRDKEKAVSTAKASLDLCEADSSLSGIIKKFLFRISES